MSSWENASKKGAPDNIQERSQIRASPADAARQGQGCTEREGERERERETKSPPAFVGDFSQVHEDVLVLKRREASVEMVLVPKTQGRSMPMVHPPIGYQDVELVQCILSASFVVDMLACVGCAMDLST